MTLGQPNSYSGESLAKKVARVRTYRRAKEMLLARRVNLHCAKAIFLPGPDACEVGALQHLMGFKPENVLAIDRDAHACEKAKTLWPALNIVHGDLNDYQTFSRARDILCSGDGMAPCEFIHLDLMGGASNSTMVNYAMWTQFLKPDGIIATTYLRGREMPTSRGALMKETIKQELPKHSIDRRAARLMGADYERAMTHFGAIIEGFFELQISVLRDRHDVPADALDWALNTGSTFFSPVGTHCYRSEHSPMGVLLVQRLEKDNFATEAYRKALCHFSRNATSSIRKDPMHELVAEADSLLKEFGKQQTLEILDLNAGTLAAYRAHLSRGTYQ